MAEPAKHFRSKVKGSALLTTAQFASQAGLRLISTIVLTRLLAPEVYGVFALVLVYRYLLEMLSDLGIRSVILTKEGDVGESFLQTCWTVSILRGFFVLLGSVLVAAVIAICQRTGVFAADSAYLAWELPWAIIALGFISLLNACQSVNRFVEERNMRFVLVTVGIVTSGVISLVATIALAYWLRSVWALVFGAFFPMVFLILFSFLAFPGPMMRFKWERESVAIIWSRGKWIIGHSLLTAATQAADRLLLGLVMTSSTFGFYYIARQLSELVLTFLRALNGQMGLQVFAHILKAPAEAVQRNYYRYRLFFDAIAGLSAGGLVVLAPTLVDIVFDDRYAAVAPMVQILALSFLLAGPLILRSGFSAERRFRRMTYLSLVSAVVLWVSLAIAIWLFEAETMALIAIALYRLPEAFLLGYLGKQRGWVSLWRETLPLVFMGLGAALGLGVDHVLRSIL